LLGAGAGLLGAGFGFAGSFRFTSIALFCGAALPPLIAGKIYTKNIPTKTTAIKMATIGPAPDESLLFPGVFTTVVIWLYSIILLRLLIHRET
jgi:hypothetical protein